MLELIKKLREKTGAGFLDCKNALVQANNNMEEAIKLIRIKGQDRAASRDNSASQGIIHSYIHPGAQIGVTLELNCETDYAARHEYFKKLAEDLAMHIAASKPQYVAMADVPSEILHAEQEIYKQRIIQEGKPEHVADKIVAGRMKKFYQETCLLEQIFIKDESKTIQQLINETKATFGENILVKKFIRFQIGE